MRGTALVAAGVATFALVVAGSAEAAGPIAVYGGGLLPALGGKRYKPTAGVELRSFRGGRVGVRFDTTLRCGHDEYLSVAGRRVGKLRHGRVTVRGHRSFRAGPRKSDRVRYRWKVTARVGPEAANGVLRISGHKTFGKHRRCIKPRRPFRTRHYRPLAGPPAAAGSRTRYFGLDSSRVDGDYKGSVVLRTGKGGRRVWARWAVKTHCRDGIPDRFENITPPARVKGNHSFARHERFTIHFPDITIKYRAFFGGRFTTDGARGKLRLTERIYDRRTGRRLTRCDSRSRSWLALRG
jgi:hypothetical protein